jgi:hypothetical protein
MGAIAQRLADRVVVTSDNPRHENPQAIVDQIVAGMKERFAKVQVEVDRRRPSCRPWPRPVRRTWCCWPARATRTTRTWPA